MYNSSLLKDSLDTKSYRTILEDSFTFKVQLGDIYLKESLYKYYVGLIQSVCDRVLRNYLKLQHSVYYYSINNPKILASGSTVFQYGLHYLEVNFAQIRKEVRMTYLLTNDRRYHELKQIAKVLLHEYCHMYQAENNTYPNMNKILKEDFQKYQSETPWDIYSNYPWEIEARDFERTFMKTAEYKEILDTIDSLYNDIKSKDKKESGTIWTGVKSSILLEDTSQLALAA